MRAAGAYDAVMRADFPMARRQSLAALCVVGLACATLTSFPSQGLPDEARLQRLREYIKTGWTTLARSTRDLPRALPDPKMPRKPGDPWLLYVSPRESRDRVKAELAPRSWYSSGASEPNNT